LDGTPIPARAPLTGAAAAAGAIGAGQIDVILAALKALPDNISEDERAGAEKILVDLAREQARVRSAAPETGCATSSTPTAPHPKTHHSSLTAKSTSENIGTDRRR